MGGQGVFVFLFGLGRQHCRIFSECWSKNAGGSSPAPSKRLCFMQNQRFVLVTGQGRQGQNRLQGPTASPAPQSQGERLPPARCRLPSSSTCKVPDWSNNHPLSSLASASPLATPLQRTPYPYRLEGSFVWPDRVPR